MLDGVETFVDVVVRVPPPRLFSRESKIQLGYNAGSPTVSTTGYESFNQSLSRDETTVFAYRTTWVCGTGRRAANAAQNSALQFDALGQFIGITASGTGDATAQVVLADPACPRPPSAIAAALNQIDVGFELSDTRTVRLAGTGSAGSRSYAYVSLLRVLDDAGHLQHVYFEIADASHPSGFTYSVQLQLPPGKYVFRGAGFAGTEDLISPAISTNAISWSGTMQFVTPP